MDGPDDGADRDRGLRGGPGNHARAGLVGGRHRRRRRARDGHLPGVLLFERDQPPDGRSAPRTGPPLAADQPADRGAHRRARAAAGGDGGHPAGDRRPPQPHAAGDHAHGPVGPHPAGDRAPLPSHVAGDRGEPGRVRPHPAGVRRPHPAAAAVPRRQRSLRGDSRAGRADQPAVPVRPRQPAVRFPPRLADGRARPAPLLQRIHGAGGAGPEQPDQTRVPVAGRQRTDGLSLGLAVQPLGPLPAGQRSDGLPRPAYHDRPADPPSAEQPPVGRDSGLDERPRQPAEAAPRRQRGRHGRDGADGLHPGPERNQHPRAVAGGQPPVGDAPGHAGGHEPADGRVPRRQRVHGRHAGVPEQHGQPGHPLARRQPPDGDHPGPERDAHVAPDPERQPHHRASGRGEPAGEPAVPDPRREPPLGLHPGPERADQPGAPRPPREPLHGEHSRHAGPADRPEAHRPPREPADGRHPGPERADRPGAPHAPVKPAVGRGSRLAGRPRRPDAPGPRRQRAGGERPPHAARAGGDGAGEAARQPAVLRGPLQPARLARGRAREARRHRRRGRVPAGPRARRPGRRSGEVRPSRHHRGRGGARARGRRLRLPPGLR